jgi:hypothetical protein
MFKKLLQLLFIHLIHVKNAINKDISIIYGDQHMDQKAVNPLAKHFRQPSIYLKLPSQGEYWPEEAIDMPANGELAIYPMTTRDEITLRTPDALINGSGVVSVIQSCCPEIKNAWLMPSIDVDAVIIAIRIASYGNTMTFTGKCPHCETIHDYGLNLHEVLSRVRMPKYENPVIVDNLKVKLYPQPYFDLNKSNMLQYEEQKLLQAIQKTEMPPEQRSVEINKQVERVIEINLETLVTSTQYIEMDSGVQVKNKEHIKEFYINCGSSTVKKVQEKLGELSQEGALKPLTVNCESCTKTFDIQVVFDYASFFDKGF